jgi:hypothetical protein
MRPVLAELAHIAFGVGGGHGCPGDGHAISLKLRGGCSEVIRLRVKAVRRARRSG